MKEQAQTAASHTPGPWSILRRHPDPLTNSRFVEIMPPDLDPDEIHPLEIAGVHLAEAGSVRAANARLIAAAPDHALFVRAVCLGVARWESGEVCTDGLRYSTDLDEFGCPAIHGPLRAGLLEVIRKATTGEDAK